jgi:flagellar biosynthesis protein FlhG
MGAGMDQAAGLRRLFSSHQEEKPQAARVAAFVSGHEACGRTMLLTHTAAALADAGERVLLIDEHGGSNSVHAALGMESRKDLLDLMQDDIHLERLVQPVTPMLGVLSAARFAAAPQRIGDAAAQRRESVFQQMQQSHAFILIDCLIRQGQSLSPLALAAPSMVVVVAAQSAAITKAYALIKQLAQARGCDGFYIAVTKARSEESAQAIFHNLRATAWTHLGVHLDYLGGVHTPVTGYFASALQSHLVGPGGDKTKCGFRPFTPEMTGVCKGLKPFESVL